MQYDPETILDDILAHLDGDRLPIDYQLPLSEDENGFRWADGAADGCTVYDGKTWELTEAEHAQMAEAVKAASDGEGRKADQLFFGLLMKYHALQLMDDLDREIFRQDAQMDYERLYGYAKGIVMDSADVGVVKLGMGILASIVEGDVLSEAELREKRDKQDMIRALGLCEEFTLFAVQNMRAWEEGNQEVFWLAQRVTGWGRIHAVRYLQPETQEIRDWLLREGWQNDVDDGYSAGECFRKAEVAKRLRGEMTDEEFTAAGAILQAMLSDESPIDHLAGWETARQDVMAYLCQAEQRDRRLVSFACVEEIADVAESEEWPEVQAKANALQGSDGKEDAGIPEDTSVYDYIAEHMEHDGGNDRLPRMFQLPHEPDKHGMTWTDGARDGVMVQEGGRELPAEARAQLAAALQAVSDGDDGTADDLFSGLLDNHAAFELMDALIDEITDPEKSWDVEALYRYGLELILEASDVEAVKIGMGILEPMRQNGAQEEEPMERGCIRLLGMSDEFTLFAVHHMLHWEHANEEIFEQAKRVHGWGRIHAVRYVKPETQEIRDWLLLEGWQNDIDAGYSADECFRKGEVAKRLRGEMDDAAFAAAGGILQAMLREGPIDHLDGWETAPQDVMAYLRQAEQHTCGLREYECVAAIADAAEAEDWPEVQEKAEALLQQEACRNAARDALREGKGFDLARRIGLPYKEAALQDARRDFSKRFWRGQYLVDDPALFEAFLQLARKECRLEQVAQVELHGAQWKAVGADLSLKFVLSLLSSKVLVGVDFVQAGLRAFVPGTRSQSVRTLEAWIQADGKPLKELSSELFEQVAALAKVEPDEQLRKRLQRLAEGRMTFPEDEERMDA